MRNVTISNLLCNSMHPITIAGYLKDSTLGVRREISTSL